MFWPMLVAVAVAAPAAALAMGADGVWRTAPTEKGSYLEVTFGPCAADAGLTCGIVTGAFTVAGADPSSPNLGKTLVADMRFDGEDGYVGGTILDPRSGKSYKSKMTVRGETMDVQGCIAFFCRGQDWTRVR